MVDLIVSFVHGYRDPERVVNPTNLPALWRPNSAEKAIFSYPFPRTPGEFEAVEGLVRGERPKLNEIEFPGKARFGFRGMATQGDRLYCATFNSIHEIDSTSFELKGILTNKLTNDLHGIAADSRGLYFVLPGRDMLVHIDFDGVVINTWTILPDLSVIEGEDLPEVDWRFVAKQKEGPYGHFHFNYVRLDGDCFWLTSRNLGCVVKLRPSEARAELVTFAHNTPVMIHDGVLVGRYLYFTSIDGKIIPVDPNDSDDYARWEVTDELGFYRHGLSAGVERISESEFGREPTWCRGIEIVDDVRYVTVDGRIGGDLSFSLIGLTKEGKLVDQHTLRWENVGDAEGLRYVTGFDVIRL